jgi:hypothetical protein
MIYILTTFFEKADDDDDCSKHSQQQVHGSEVVTADDGRGV